jgi:pimeloyl-ACP methyl ester carboxylesterase
VRKSEDEGSRSVLHRLERFRAAHPPKRVESGGAAWEYIACGVGESTLLLLPGAPGRAETAFRHILRFKNRYRMISASYPATPLTVEDILRGLVTILDAEGIGSACVVGGSYSGLIAQSLVRRYPERVERLVLSDTGVPLLGRGRRYARYLKLLRVLPEWAIRALWRAGAFFYLREIKDDRPFWRAYFRELVSTITKQECISRLSVWVDFDLHSRFSPADLDGWPGRVLLLWAESDRTFSARERAHLKRLYPRAAMRTFGGGHAASLSFKGEYLDAIARFVEDGRHKMDDR